MNAISRDVALEICAEIRHNSKGKWYTPGGLQCWFCTIFSKGDPDKMCVSNREGYRGCNLVNKRYEQVKS